MPSARRSLSTRVGEFFAIDDDWERPASPIGRRDWLVGIVLSVAGILFLELARSVVEIHAGGQPLWVQWAAIVSGAMLMVWRRQHPILVGVLAAGHMFIVGVTMPMVMAQLALQTVYFVAIYAAVAYARHRRSALLVVAGITVFMLLWVGWQLALGGGLAEMTEDSVADGADGWFSPNVGAVATTVAVNAFYFVGAILVGQIAWRGARQRARLEEQAQTIARQADSLKRRAVVDERLRIARELHDVVGHHVSVIGIQAAAARRVIDKRPDEAAKALSQIEESSRDAVSQMRSLLGTLRDIQETADVDDAAATEQVRSKRAKGPAAQPSRSPEPGLTDLPALVAERTANGLTTAYELVETREGAHARVAPPIALTLYRITQEALANITRHSTATTSDVVLRVVEDAPAGAYAEVEVLDNGRARVGTSGTGLGQLGMRERAASHKGTVEIGARPTGGYRVRVRIPLGELDVASI
ncbi:putative two-component system sensor kinase [Janibacter sp. HTCC2649]|uniref:sensor histidine kinase n=1 Tax=Janibacter sp. HTCC2649 TaxID=313589 RepID=UPI0000670882|nr:sensor histidine kinase [Janibacter sp. HTCC2649]EAQ00851.1 putative two-component system sensor kinase [Janibacter sp. HTCC2649]